MQRKLTGLMMTLLILIVVLTGCGGKQAANVIKIGVFEPMTGANAGGGQLEVDGIKLANQLYPEVLGKKVELVIADNKSDKVEAATAAARLVEREKVTAIIGSWGSSLSMAAGDIVRKGQIPAVGASCTNPLVTQGNDYYFRVCFIDPFQGVVMSNYAFQNLNARNAAIVQEVSNDYAVGLANYFSINLKKLTNDPDCIVAVANYNTGDQDFSAQLTNIKSKNPDVIFAPGNFTESALLISQARKLGITCPIIGGDTWETQEFLDIGKEAVEGVVFSTFFASETPITEASGEFLDEYRKAFNKEPAAVTALGYDAYLLILDAIERAGVVDPVKVRDEIAKTGNFEGAAGYISLDENGDAVKDAVIKQVKDGKFVYLDTIRP